MLLRSKKSNILRFVTYNIQRFCDDTGKSSLPTIIETLKKLKPTVICLNEVDRRNKSDYLFRLAESLKMDFHFAPTNPNWTCHYGNAILISRDLWMVRTESIQLRGGSILRWKGGEKRIQRGLLAVTFQISEELPLFSVLCTHLDHIQEKERVTQTKHILEYIKQQCNAKQLSQHHLILGDLNALQKMDYSKEEWHKIEQKSMENGWKPPVDAVSLDIFTTKPHCYQDAFATFHWMNTGQRLKSSKRQKNTRDTGKKCILKGNKFTAHVQNPMYRIDYGLLSPTISNGLSEGGYWTLKNSFIDTTAKGSDHFPLVIDLQQNAEVYKHSNM